MVVVGLARVAAVGEMEARVCSVEWHRQWLHLQQYQHHSSSGTKTAVASAAATGKDALPVVELKPFVRKVWRREKSLPVFYEKQSSLKDPPGLDCTSPGPADVSPEVARYIRELRSQRKQAGTRQSVTDSSQQRCRAKLHPVAEFSFQTHGAAAEHQQDLVPSFSTRFERTKTSLAAAHAEDSGRRSRSSDGSGSGSGVTEAAPAEGAARQVSSLMSAYIRDKSLQQNVYLTGGKLSVTNLGRRPLLYLHPISAYRHKKPQSGDADKDRKTGGGAGDGKRRASSMPLTRGSGFARANGGLPRRTDLVLCGSTFRQTADKLALRPLRYEGSTPHKFHSKLGAAQDSLLILGQIGSPTALERNLSHDLELRLERCRRERSFAPLPESSLPSAAHYVAYDSQPTPGEITLKRAREANKPPGRARPAHKWSDPRKPLPSPLPSPRHAAELPGNLRLGFAEFGASPRSRSEQGDSGIQSSASGDPLDDAAFMGSHGYVMPDGPSHDLGRQVILEDPDEETDTDAWTSREGDAQALFVSETHVQGDYDLRDMNKSVDECKTKAGTVGVLSRKISSNGCCDIRSVPSDSNRTASSLNQKTDSFEEGVFEKQAASEHMDTSSPTVFHAPEQEHFRSRAGYSFRIADDSQSPVSREGEPHTSVANSDVLESSESPALMDGDENVTPGTFAPNQAYAETPVVTHEELAGVVEADSDAESRQTSSDEDNHVTTPKREESDDVTEIDKSTIFLTSSGGEEAFRHQSKSL